MQFLYKSFVFNALGALLFGVPLSAQSVGIPLQSPTYALLDRLEILSGVASGRHPEIQFGYRRDAAKYALQLDSVGYPQGNRRDAADIQYLLADNDECLSDSARRLRFPDRRGFLKHFYRTPAHLFAVNTPDFHLRVNPILHLQGAREQKEGEWLFQNQRGIDIRGDLDRKLFFHTQLVETQAKYPNYVSQRVREHTAVPNVGFFKPFASQLLDIQDAYDFNVATAYVGFQATRHFGVQLGHGKHFIGNGYRSMFLSDFAAPVFFLKLDTRVWKFHYQNLFLELSPVSQVQIPDGTILPKKYAAMHYLNFQASPNVAFGFFEATVFNRSRQFELQYFNPLVFYRTVEGMIGSPDNVLLGFDARWNLLRRVQLYGQVMLDELATAEIFSRSGWWANKWGIQVGAKYPNALGIEHLDMQVEHNRARPYTYAHADSTNGYTHYNQPLAHPLGANFSETLLLVRWQPLPRWVLQARAIRMNVGENSPTENWGANPLLDYDARVQDYDNRIGQGVSANIDLVGVDLSWQLWHNAFVDLQFLYRKKDSRDDWRDLRSRVFGVGFRMNIWNPRHDF